MILGGDFIARLSLKKEFEIRNRFEYGEDLKTLAIKYKVPLRTLEDRKKRSALKGDPWLKGFRKKIAYEDFVKDNETRKKELLEKFNEKARKEMDILEILLEERYVNGEVLDEEIEEAFTIRTIRIANALKLRKEIEGIYTEADQVIIDKTKMDIELKKVELEGKALDLELKKKTMAHYLKKG